MKEEDAVVAGRNAVDPESALLVGHRPIRGLPQEDGRVVERGLVDGVEHDTGDRAGLSVQVTRCGQGQDGRAEAGGCGCSSPHDQIGSLLSGLLIGPCLLGYAVGRESVQYPRIRPGPRPLAGHGACVQLETRVNYLGRSST